MPFRRRSTWTSGRKSQGRDPTDQDGLGGAKKRAMSDRLGASILASALRAPTAHDRSVRPALMHPSRLGAGRFRRERLLQHAEELEIEARELEHDASQGPPARGRLSPTRGLGPNIPT